MKIKTILILTIYLSIITSVNSQNIEFQEICKIACENFDNINKEYTKSIISSGFNFNTMKNVDDNLYKNVYVKSYFFNCDLVKIEIIDTLNLGRNIDIDIIYESDNLFIGTIFFWENSKRNRGDFSSGIFINNKKKRTSYFAEREFVNLVITDKEIENPKEIFPFKNKPEYFFQFVSSIKVLDSKLFVKYNLNFEYRVFKSFRKYEYKKDKIIESKYIIKDKNFPYCFLEKYLIDDIYKLFTIIFFKYNYQKTYNMLKISSVYSKDKPLWIY